MKIALIDILMALSFFTSVVLSIYLFIKAGHNKASRYLAYGSGGAAIWILANIIFRHQDDFFLSTLIKIEYLAGAFVLMDMFLFSYYFLTPQKKPNKKLFFITVISILILSILIVFTDFIIVSGSITKNPDSYKVGDLYLLYIIYSIIFALLSFYYLIKKLFWAKEKAERSQLIYMIVGISVSFTTAMIADILLPMMGNFDIIWLGPITFTVFVSLTSYVMLRHHLFNLKIITTELLVFAILTIAFVQIFVSMTPGEILSKILFFCIILFLSSLLLQGIYKETKQRKKIEELAQRLSDFVSFASHELRNPITKLRGVIEIMLEGKKSISKKNKDSLELSSEIVTEMNQNIETFLDFNKMETGNLELTKQKVSFEEIVQQCIKDFENRAKLKFIEIKFKSEKNLPKINIDKFKICHVITNLIDNAIKYTSKYGSIEVGVKKEKNNLICSVKDTGIGIDPKTVPLLFRRYERGDPETKKLFKGSGIGLFLSKKLVEMHKGKIWAESTGENQGSTFFIKLPI